MAFGDFKDKAEKLKDASASVAGAGMEKVNQLLDDFNKSVPAIKALGLSVENFRMDMGTIPEINARITGSVDAIDSEKLQKVADENQDNKILVSLMKGLQAAANAKGKLGELGFKGVEADIKLGLPPKISVGFRE